MHPKGIHFTANADTPVVKTQEGCETIFIDITTTQNNETYRLVEIHFKDDMFDQVEVLSACEYR